MSLFRSVSASLSQAAIPFDPITPAIAVVSAGGVTTGVVVELEHEKRIQPARKQRKKIMFFVEEIIFIIECKLIKIKKLKF